MPDPSIRPTGLPSIPVQMPAAGETLLEDRKTDRVVQGGHLLADELVHCGGITALEAGAELGGHVMGAVASALAGGAHAVLIVKAYSDLFIDDMVDAQVAPLVETALGGTPLPGVPRDAQMRESKALAVGAVLLGASPERIRELRAACSDFRAFDHGLDLAREERVHHPSVFRDAAEQYGRLTRDWQDGIASALEGWSDPRRNEAFALGRAQGEALAGARPEAVAQARAAKKEGFRAASGRDGEINQERYMLDGSYRSGVEHYRRTHRTVSADDLARVQRRLEREEIRHAARLR